MRVRPDSPADGGLSRSALADEPEHLAGVDLEAHTVDGAESGAAESTGKLDPEVCGDHKWRFARGQRPFHRAFTGLHRTGAEIGYGGEKALGVFVLRVFEQARSIRLLDHLALVHHGHAIGEVGDDAHVVGDKYDGGVEFVAASAQQVENLGLNGHVEGGGRLVSHDELGVEHERHGDHHPLLLTPRELVRVVVHPRVRLRDADLLEVLDRLGLRLGARVRAMRAKTFGDLPPHGVHRVERR
jgi:hypothetical protein